MKKQKWLYGLGLLCLLLVGWKTTSNYLQVGDGTNAANKKLIFDVGNGSTNPQIAFDVATSKLTFTNDGVNTKNLGSGSGSGSGINLLDNPGCENGTSTPDNWTASGGSLTRTTTAANVAYETAACSFDASGSGQSVRPTDVVVPEILEGNPCLAEIYYKADSITNGDYIFYVEDSTGTDLTSSVSLNATNGSWVKANIAFTCPSSASVRFKIESAVSNPNAILFDQAHLGSMKNDFLAQDPAEIVAHTYYPGVNNCSWEVSDSINLGATATDSDCTAPTVELSSPIVSINSSSGLSPNIVFTTLPAGTYEVTANFQSKITGGTPNCVYALYDGSSYSGRQSQASSTTGDVQALTLVGTFSHSGGAKTFSIHGGETSDNCFIDNQVGSGTATTRLEFIVKRFPASSTSKVTLETQGWYIDANWRDSGAAATSLSTGAVASMTEIANSNGVLSLNTGSATAMVPCSSTNPPTGLTCSAGNEVIGIAFTPPYVGSYLACVGFTWSGQADSTVSVAPNFQFSETQTNSSTVITQGKNARFRLVGSAANEVMTAPAKICTVVNFTSVTQKVLRLMYTQSVSGTVDGSAIVSSDDTGDVSITVVPLTQSFPQAVALSSMAVGGSSGCLNGESVCYGTYTPTLTNGTNVASSTAGLATYQRLGGQVCVQYQLTNVDPTAAGPTLTSLGISLPIASNLAASSDLNGTDAGQASATTAYQLGNLEGDATNDRATLNFNALDTAARQHSGQFCYRILP